MQCSCWPRTPLLIVCSGCIFQIGCCEAIATSQLSFITNIQSDYFLSWCQLGKTSWQKKNTIRATPIILQVENETTTHRSNQADRILNWMSHSKDVDPTQRYWSKIFTGVRSRIWTNIFLLEEAKVVASEPSWWTDKICSKIFHCHRKSSDLWWTKPREISRL